VFVGVCKTHKSEKRALGTRKSTKSLPKKKVYLIHSAEVKTINNLQQRPVLLVVRTCCPYLVVLPRNRNVKLSSFAFFFLSFFFFFFLDYVLDRDLYLLTNRVPICVRLGKTSIAHVKNAMKR
jgi:hypothetical protein